MLEGNLITLCKLRSASKIQTSTLNAEKNTVCVSDNNGRVVDSKFKFDKVFAQDSSRESIFESIEHLIQECSAGKQTMMMSLGTTNAGKSYNMFGDSSSLSSEGIVQRSIRKLIASGVAFYMSFYEVYNDRIINLLETDEKSNSKATQTVEQIRGTYLRKGHNVTELLVLDADYGIELINHGISRRSTHPTA